MDILIDFQDIMVRVESPSHFDLIKFRVQFVCNLGGNYGQYGHCGRFFLLFVDYIDSVDACIHYGQLRA
jgi:hypothetical protein